MTRRLLAMAVTTVVTAAGIAVAEPASALVTFSIHGRQSERQQLHGAARRQHRQPGAAHPAGLQLRHLPELHLHAGVGHHGHLHHRHLDRGQVRRRLRRVHGRQRHDHPVALPQQHQPAVAAGTGDGHRHGQDLQRGRRQLRQVHRAGGGASAANTGLVQLPCSTATSRVWRLPDFTAGGAGGGSTFTNPLDPQGPDPWLQYYNGFYYLATTTWNRTITMRRSATLRRPGHRAGHGDLQPDPAQRRGHHVGAGVPPAQRPQRAALVLLLHRRRRSRSTSARSASTCWRAPGWTRWARTPSRPTCSTRPQNNTWELDGSILQLNGQLYLMGTFYNGSQPTVHPAAEQPVDGQRHPPHPVHRRPAAGRRSAARSPKGRRCCSATEGPSSSTRPATAPRPTTSWACSPTTAATRCCPSSWIKSPNPVFQRSNANGVYGPGHNGFFKSPDGTEDWMVYHANSSASGGCDMNRTTRAQKFTWNADGTPNFGIPVSLSTTQTSPSGEPTG